MSRTERAASWASAIASVEGEMDRRRHFSANRSFPTWEAAKAALGTFKAGAPGGAGEGAPVAAYGDARIDGWKVDGRVFERKSEREGGGAIRVQSRIRAQVRRHGGAVSTLSHNTLRCDMSSGRSAPLRGKALPALRFPPTSSSPVAAQRATRRAWTR